MAPQKFYNRWAKSATANRVVEPNAQGCAFAHPLFEVQSSKFLWSHKQFAHPVLRATTAPWKFAQINYETWSLRPFSPINRGCNQKRGLKEASKNPMVPQKFDNRWATNSMGNKNNYWLLGIPWAPPGTARRKSSRTICILWSDLWVLQMSIIWPKSHTTHFIFI